MVTVGVHEAKTTLSELLRRVAAGEEVTITRGGEPVAFAPLSCTALVEESVDGCGAVTEGEQ